MNNVLDMHGCGRSWQVPEGLRELMSDISREVIRVQPRRIFRFIANYLSCLIMTRENSLLVVRLLEDLCDCQPTLSTHLLYVGLTRQKSNEVAKMINNAIVTSSPPTDRDTGEPQRITKAITKACKFDAKFSKHLSRIIESAYRIYWYRKKCLEESLIVTTNEPWTIAARRTLALYKRTKPSFSELIRASEKIQFAYRAYHEKKKLLRHLKTSIQTHVMVEDDYTELLDLDMHEMDDVNENQSIIEAFINANKKAMVLKSPKPTSKKQHLLDDDSAEDLLLKNIKPVKLGTNKIAIGSINSGPAKVYEDRARIMI